MSSAYVISFIQLFGGIGVSDVYTGSTIIMATHIL